MACSPICKVPVKFAQVGPRDKSLLYVSFCNPCPTRQPLAGQRAPADLPLGEPLPA